MPYTQENIFQGLPKTKPQTNLHTIKKFFKWTINSLLWSIKRNDQSVFPIWEPTFIIINRDSSMNSALNISALNF